MESGEGDREEAERKGQKGRDRREGLRSEAEGRGSGGRNQDVDCFGLHLC